MDNSQMQTKGTIRNRWALLVGINHYIDQSVSDLSYCVNDVLALQKKLDQLGYTTVCLHDQAGKEHLQPTVNNVLAELARLCQVADQEDMLLVYFSGHGTLFQGKPVLITQETRFPILPNRALTLAEIEGQMRSSRTKRQVLLLDACHAGVKMNRAAGDDDFIRNAYELAEGFALIAASTAEQTALEAPDVRHGLFTHFLLEGLSGLADTGGKKFVTVNDLKVYVLDGLRKWTITHGAAIQLPTARTEGFGDIILADLRKPGVANAAQAQIPPVKPPPTPPPASVVIAQPAAQSPAKPPVQAQVPPVIKPPVPAIVFPPRPQNPALNHPKSLVGGKIITKENAASLHEVFSIFHSYGTQFGSTTRLTVSPDGRWLATSLGDANYQVSVWDIASHQIVHRTRSVSQESSKREIYQISFSPDGKFLVYIQGNALHLVRCQDWSVVENIPKIKNIYRIHLYPGRIALCSHENTLLGDWYGVGELRTFPELKVVQKIKLKQFADFEDVRILSPDILAFLNYDQIAVYSNGKKEWEERLIGDGKSFFVNGQDPGLFVMSGYSLLRVDPIKHRQESLKRGTWNAICTNPQLMLIQEQQPNFIQLTFFNKENMEKVFSLPIEQGSHVATFSPDGSYLVITFGSEIRIFGV